MNNDNDLQPSEAALNAPCKQNAPASNGNGVATALAKPPRRGRKDGHRVSGYMDNRNSMRHGLRASKLPAKCGWIHREVRGFRRAVEDAVVSVHGEVSILHAASINTACRAEVHAQLAARWLRDQIDELDAAQRLNYSAAVVKASESRDKALATLGIDRRTISKWDALDAANGARDPKVIDAPNASAGQPDQSPGHLPSE